MFLYLEILLYSQRVNKTVRRTESEQGNRLSIEFLQTDFDKVSYLANLLTARATGLASDDREFTVLRHELLSNNKLAAMLPKWLRQIRDLDSFWCFIKLKFSTYAERRTFISEEFTTVLDALEFGKSFTAQPQNKSPSRYAVTPQPPAQHQIVARNKRKIFIVHGRDNSAKQEVRNQFRTPTNQTLLMTCVSLRPLRLCVLCV
jgi:hypothetical protein